MLHLRQLTMMLVTHRATNQVARKGKQETLCPSAQPPRTIAVHHNITVPRLTVARALQGDVKTAASMWICLLDHHLRIMVCQKHTRASSSGHRVEQQL